MSLGILLPVRAMSKTFLFKVRLVLVIFAVALFSAGIGIGGGTLLVSILVSVFGFDFKTAASTSLATIIPISFTGAVGHFLFSPGIPSLNYYYIFVPACVMGTVLGGKLVQRRPNRWLQSLFSLFLLVVSLRILNIFDLPSFVYQGLDRASLGNEWFLMVSVGGCIGVIAVVLGLGCGLLIVPFHVIVTNFDMHEAITLSLTTMFFISVSATLVHRRNKALDIPPLKVLFVPALVGAITGATISSGIPAPVLKKLFGLVLLVAACNYIMYPIAVQVNLFLSSRSYKRI